MEIITLPIESLTMHKGNAKLHPQEQIDQIKESIKLYGFNDPIGIWGKKNTIVEGHGRYMAAKEMGIGEVPCIRLDHLSDKQRREYMLVHNQTTMNSGWDFDLLTDELDGLDFDGFDFGFGDNQNNEWFNREQRDGTEREDDNKEYNDFLDKFEAKKTTDDCYTPDEIYDAVANWVAAKYGLNKKKFFRPFYPGGDYQRENYSGKIVVDNPPFSILAEIKRFYVERGIKFFLFAPTLTLFSAADCDATFIPCGATITYENGAKVATSFVTNLENSDLVVKTEPELYAVVYEADKIVQAANKTEVPKYEYPDNVLTAAIAARWCKYGVDYTLKRSDCVKITALDEQKESGDAVFGGGFLLSEQAAIERANAEKAAIEKAAIEKAAIEKAAIEKAAAIKWKLSARELEIVQRLGKNR